MDRLDPMELMRAAQKMQEELERVQDDLGKRTVEASAGGGMVTATANGRLEIVGVRIDKSVIDPADVSMLQDLVTAAVNQALSKARDMAQSEMQRAAGIMGLPGGLPGGGMPPGFLR
jgi:DNA-binding YbaB/EbfC family protein